MKADLLAPYMNLVRIAHQITLYLTLLHATMSATIYLNCASAGTWASQHRVELTATMQATGVHETFPAASCQSDIVSARVVDRRVSIATRLD